ncbi:hypothetical protein GCM10023183_09980 [Nibribacter koreensis]|uniref:AMP-binding enzyme C-terminal domain-containing protein n=1 Tax=Nibribacter koreensis TaxID=1084519 RepID=A0ABP8FBT7_9BACT
MLDTTVNLAEVPAKRTDVVLVKLVPVITTVELGWPVVGATSEIVGTVCPFAEKFTVKLKNKTKLSNVKILSMPLSLIKELYCSIPVPSRSNKLRGLETLIR